MHSDSCMGREKVFSWRGQVFESVTPKLRLELLREPVMPSLRGGTSQAKGVAPTKAVTDLCPGGICVEGFLDFNQRIHSLISLD